MQDNSLLRRVLWAATTICLLGGLIAVPAVDDRDEDRIRTVVADTATGAGGDGATTTPAGEPVPDTVAPPLVGSSDAPPTTTAAGRAGPQGTTATTSGPARNPSVTAPAEDLGRPRDPGATVPPKPGSYRYRTNAQADGQQHTSESIASVVDRGRADGETRQIYSMRGGGLDSDSELSWRRDGVYVLKSTFIFGERRGECDWTPDIKQSALPLAKDVTWESTSSCTMTGFGPTPVTITRKITGKVLELRRVRIAGQVLDTWAIDTTEHVEFAGNVVDSTAVALFSPKHGLTVQATGKGSGSGGGGGGSGEFTTELLNLNPE